MRKRPARSMPVPRSASRGPRIDRRRPTEIEELRRKLADAEAELEFYRNKQEWLQSALANQRHARQTLEASLSANYPETISSLRDVVRSAVPRGATVLVVSRGDQELLNLDGLRAWHFPRGNDGGYAGYYPADSTEAIGHLESLIAIGAKFILFPNTALWWLEHYRQFQEYLDHVHLRVIRDARCALYRLSENVATQTTAQQVSEPQKRQTAPPAPVITPEPASVRDSDVLSPWTPGLTSAAHGQEMPARPSARYDVLCFPVINWDGRFQRPQQLMSRFAAAGHRVFYLSHEFRKTGVPHAIRNLAENLYEVSLRGPGFLVRQQLMDDDTVQCLFSSLLALRQDYSLSTPVAMIQLPFWWPLVKRCAETFQWRVVYDCMDFRAGFSDCHPVILEQERDLLIKAQLVVASSVMLEANARKYNSNVLLLRNGCDYEHFAKVKGKPVGPRPVIGYYGAISDWFDSDLVADLAERRMDWDFILVGATDGADLRRLSRLKNVSLPGEKPYTEIPKWLQKFDVAILPFKRTPLTEAVNPVKAYEIFAAGKPLVSVPLPEMYLLSQWARLASTPDGFEKEIEAECSDPDPGAEIRRRAFAKENTWEKRFMQLSCCTNALSLAPPGLQNTSHLSEEGKISRPPAPGPKDAVALK